MPAPRARSCIALIVGSAATQRGRWPQFSCMKSSRNSAVVLGSTVTGFSSGGGGIWTVDHSLTTSVACAGIAPQANAAITTDAALERNHPIIASMRPSCSLTQDQILSAQRSILVGRCPAYQADAVFCLPAL